MLNGAFGAGKTTLAGELLVRQPDWLLFDPEEVGSMLWKLCPEPQGDFQDLTAWAPLVVETARALFVAYGRTLAVPMTLIHPGNFEIVRREFQTVAPTHHFALIASPTTIARRLVERGDAEGGWAHERIDACVTALSRPEFAIHLDAERKTSELADDVLERL